MEINIGDKVRFLNAVGGGKVTGFQKGGLVLVEDEDGFEVPMLQSEVVVVSSEGRTIHDFLNQKQDSRQPASTASGDSSNKPAVMPASGSGKAMPHIETTANTPSRNTVNNTVSSYSASQAPADSETDEETLEARVLRLELTVRRLQRRLERLEDAKALREKVKGERQSMQEQLRAVKDQPLEVDLHIEELLDTTAGMSAADIKEYQLSVFRKTMREHLNDKGKRIVFIHGNGDGVLRKSIIDELRHTFKTCQYQDASFQQYGFGATMVIVR